MISLGVLSHVPESPELTLWYIRFEVEWLEWPGYASKNDRANQKFSFGTQKMKSILRVSTGTCCIFVEWFYSQECARGLQFALQPYWSRPKWKELKEMDEGCTNLMGFGFTGSPTKYTRIQLSLIMGSQIWLFSGDPRALQQRCEKFSIEKVPLFFMVGHDEENTEDVFPTLWVH